MNEKIFRKKSIDQVNSPEDLNSYLRVTNPPIWFALLAISVLVAGALVWMLTVPVETGTTGFLISDGNQAVCYITEEDAKVITSSAYIEIDGVKYAFKDAEKSVYVRDILNQDKMEMANWSKDSKLIGFSLEGKVESGSQLCSVILESKHPIDFLFQTSNRAD